MTIRTAMGPLPPLDPTSFKFLKRIHRGKASSIFKIEYNDEVYALKVFHDDGGRHSAYLHRKASRFYKEVRAYKNLYTHGACDSGLVPKYYGHIRQLDPKQLDPKLDLFLEEFNGDKYHPGALLLELLDSPEPISPANYSTERLAKAIESLQQVHRAWVVQNDIYPQNILIVPGDPERVLITDFDVARSFSSQEEIDKQLGFCSSEPICDWELGNLKGLGELLEEDQKNGLLHDTSFR